MDESVPYGGLKEYSECSLGRPLKAPKKFSEGKPEAEAWHKVWFKAQELCAESVGQAARNFTQMPA